MDNKYLVQAEEEILNYTASSKWNQVKRLKWITNEVLDLVAIAIKNEREGKQPEESSSDCVLPVVSNWVAVTDHLPNRGDEVLTITKDEWFRVMTFGSTGRRFPAQVTHWQILPKPPCY